MVEARRKEGSVEGDPGVLAASGMIAGEGLAGVAIAFIVAARETGWIHLPASLHFAEKDFTWISGAAGAVVGIALVVAVSAMLYRAGRSAEGVAKSGNMG
jgi:hypothetical protein